MAITNASRLADFGSGIGTEGILEVHDINATGVVTATEYHGDGSNLSGIDASALKSGGVVKIQANSSGAVVSGILTATSYRGDGSELTGVSVSNVLTLGVRAGSAVTFSISGPSFNAIARGGGNIPITI